MENNREKISVKYFFENKKQLYIFSRQKYCSLKHILFHKIEKSINFSGHQKEPCYFYYLSIFLEINTLRIIHIEVMMVIVKL